MNECLLVAVGHSEAAIPLPASTSHAAMRPLTSFSGKQATPESRRSLD
jgi:hypothetical protein